MGTASKLLATQTGDKRYVDDVFSTYLYTGNGSTQTINNGIDLAGEGGLVWIKSRSAATNNFLFDTNRGALNEINSNTTEAQASLAGSVTSFNSNGFTLGSAAGINVSAATYASWTFRKAPKFFDVVTYVGDGTTNRAISHSLGQEVGMIQTKATSAAGDWNTYHRSATGDLKLNLTNAQTASKTIIPSATSTTFTVNGVANTNGVTYVAYLYAHDTEEDGMIQCGSFTTDGSGNATVNLGWEPQYVMIKNANGVAYDWSITDSMRGSKSGYDSTFTGAKLSPNLSNSETQFTMSSIFTSTGFAQVNMYNSTNYIYMAIRRPNKPPESGSEVFAPVYRGNDNSKGNVYETGFVVDADLLQTRSTVAGHYFRTRLTNGVLDTQSTAAESATSGWYASNTGVQQLSATLDTNYINWCFKRAPGFFDVVTYTGDGVAGRTVNHNLGAVPEMVIVKFRSGGTSNANWTVYHANTTVTRAQIFINLTNAASADNVFNWNNTSPTDAVFTVGAGGQVNANNDTYIAYLFASLPNISKVGSYIGNGTSQTIDCGFSTGARFILIKRTDSTGDWYVWDTARGIVAANDPHLSLNTTAAEVTTDDSIDPDSSGFIVNQVAATNINVNAASYIFLSIA